ncbi:MAG: hypothetical protein H0X46_05955 [Bacteroidetes bacterium]|nr:hypothetical protein [Bacteroidota bacterium]
MTKPSCHLFACFAVASQCECAGEGIGYGDGDDSTVTVPVYSVFMGKCFTNMMKCFRK